MRRADRRIIAAVRGGAARWERLGVAASGTSQRRASEHIVARCLALVATLADHADGLRSEELAEALGVSRPTIDRDLRTLRSAGVAIETDRVATPGEPGAVSMHRLPGA